MEFPASVLSEDLASLLERQATEYNTKTCLTFDAGEPAGSESISFAELQRRVTGVRLRLQKLGVNPGDRVCLMMGNSIFYPIAWLAIASIGAICVPVNSRLGLVDAGYVFENSGCRLVIADAATTSGAERSASSQTEPPVVIAVEGDWYYVGRGDARFNRPTARTVANIQYTSGTTGFPKGCVLTHSFWQMVAAVAGRLLALGPDSTLLCAQPHSYSDPLWNLVAGLQAGAHVVLLDGFHPSSFMRSVARWQTTAFYCLGVMPTLLLKQPAAPWDREHRLTRVLCSGMPAAQHREIEQRWGVPWLEAYGMNETALNTAVTLDEHDELVGSGSIGRPLSHCEASIVDEDGNEVRPGAVGDLRVRGLGFMEGYWRNPEATASFFRSGWANTGDLVERDAKGRLFFRGRRKEMIRRGGENISPLEVETVLRSHPAVLDCALRPVPDADLEEEAKAYVVLREGSSVDAEALYEYLASNLAIFKVPRYFEFRDALPHTPSERVAKHLLEAGRSSWRIDTRDMRPRQKI